MESKFTVKAIATFLITFGAQMNILFIIKVKILVLIKWPYRSLPIMLTIESGMAIIIERLLQQAACYSHKRILTHSKT